jgi:hypothetical protein
LPAAVSDQAHKLRNWFFVGQGSLPDAGESSLASFWAAAMATWDKERIPRIHTQHCID